MISKIKAHTKSTYRFESCPGYKEFQSQVLVSLRLSDEPIKIGDSVERHAHGYVVGGHPYNTLYDFRFKS